LGAETGYVIQYRVDVIERGTKPRELLAGVRRRDAPCRSREQAHADWLFQHPDA